MKVFKRKFSIGRRLEFRGFLIEGNEDGVKICPDPGKIEAVKEMRTPTCKKVREFLGLSKTLEY